MFARAGIERAILTLMVTHKSVMYDVSNEGIEAYHFLSEHHKILYSVIMHLFYNQGVEKLDAMLIYSTIQDEQAKEVIDENGGLEYISTLFSAYLTNNSAIYIRQLKEAYQRNSLNDILTKAVEKVKTNDIDEIITTIDSQIADVILSDKKKETYKLGTNTKERLKERLENPVDVFGYAIGWKQFDKVSQGFQDNDLVVVVGESKTGKSTLLTNWTIRLTQSGLNGLYIDTEMDDDEFEDRVLAILSSVPFEEIRNGKYGVDTEYGLAKDKIAAVNKAADELDKLNIYHEYMPEFTIEKVTALAKYFKKEKNIDFLTFDYIKMPNSDLNSLKQSKEYERLGYFTTCLKDLAGLLKIPVLTACQSNRSQLGSTDLDAGAIQGSYRILQLASKLYFIRNKTDNEITNEGGRYGNQALLIKYQRHGGNNTVINIQFDRPILKQKEVS